LVFVWTSVSRGQSFYTLASYLGEKYVCLHRTFLGLEGTCFYTVPFWLERYVFLHRIFLKSGGYVFLHRTLLVRKSTCYYTVPFWVGGHVFLHRALLVRKIRVYTPYFSSSGGVRVPTPYPSG
jgi:hypothetical protein